MRERRLRDAESADGDAEEGHHSRGQVGDRDLDVALRRGIGEADLERRCFFDGRGAHDPERVGERDYGHRLVAVVRLLEMERAVGSEIGALGLYAGGVEPENRSVYEGTGGEDFRFGAAERNEIDVDGFLLALRHREGIDLLLLVAGAAHGQAQLALRHAVDHKTPDHALAGIVAGVALADVAGEDRTPRYPQ